MNKKKLTLYILACICPKLLAYASPDINNEHNNICISNDSQKICGKTEYSSNVMQRIQEDITVLDNSSNICTTNNHTTNNDTNIQSLQTLQAQEVSQSTQSGSMNNIAELPMINSVNTQTVNIPPTPVINPPAVTKTAVSNSPVPMAVPTPVMNTPPAVINPPAAGKIPKAISPHNLPQKQTIQSNHIEEEIIQEIMNDTSFIMRKPYQNKITLPIQNKNVLSPMMLFDSVKKDSINELYALLQQGIDINIQNNKNGQTAVMFASKYNKIKTLRFLIEHGADLSIVDVNGRTALHLAAMNNNVDAMIVLINSDIDPLIKDNEGRRASDYIKDNRVVLLMAANYKDMNKALIDFVSLSSISGVEYALNHGANINIQDDIGQEGDTPLMIAVKLNNLNMISMLLNHGADLYAKNKLKQTVFDIVKNNTGIANILKTVQITRDLSK